MGDGYTCNTIKVNYLVLLAGNKQLNLSPAFQRQSVWSKMDRKKLVESLLESRPIPSIFLYRTTGNDGKTIYLVIDGKQRLETLFMFMGKGGYTAADAFQVHRVNTDGKRELAYWTDLSAAERNHILDAEIQTVELDWELGDVIDLFMRINSTGKRLTTAEKLNAKWIDNPVLRESKVLAASYESFFRRHKIFSAVQITRMKHVEFVAELLVSLVVGHPINKKRELDRLVSGPSGIRHEDLTWACAELRRTLKRIDVMFPKLGQTRLNTGTEMYTLVLLVHRMQTEGYVLTNARRNAEAQQLLIRFGLGVDEVNSSTRGGAGIEAYQTVYMDYLNTVRSDTDSAKQRKKRAGILSEVLSGVFESQASARIFSPLQRRILWHSSANQACSVVGCKVRLTWNNFTVDHVKAFSKGGPTDLGNAELMCKSHNSAKGAR